jgi:serine phosphatase RsbU (regulator of sigma subunit)
VRNVERMAPAVALDDPERLAALVAAGLGARSDPAFEIFTRLVRQLGVPVSLVSLVGDTRQVFPGANGVDEPWATRRETPLSHSICQHVVRSGTPLIVTDARDDPLLRDSLAIGELGVIGYAGMPLVDGQGNTLGSLSAIDTGPRHWTDRELDILRDLAAACSSELQLRIAVSQADAARQDAELARLEAEEARAHAEEAGARLDLLAQVSRETASTLDADLALRRLADLLVPSLGDWCVMDLLDGELVQRVVVKHSRPEVTIARLGRRHLPQLQRETAGPLATILRGERPRRIVRFDEADLPAPGADPLHDAQRQLFDALGGHSALIFALPGRQRIVGAITLVRDDDRPFVIGELTMLDEVARRAGLALDNATQFQSQRRAAETLQASLLTTLPDTADLELCARYEPAVEASDVGGDWYDAFPLADGQTALVIGDVVGHDVHAASRMGQLRNMLRTLASDRGATPSELLSRLDRVASRLGVDALSTCVLGIMAPVDGRDGAWRLTWSNAGHLPPVLLRPDGASRLLDGGGDLMIGVDPATPRRDHSALLERGDTVILVTDGLVETRGASLDEGLARLQRLMAATVQRPLDELCDELVAASIDTTNSDDIAAIAVRVPREIRRSSSGRTATGRSRSEGPLRP